MPLYRIITQCDHVPAVLATNIRDRKLQVDFEMIMKMILFTFLVIFPFPEVATETHRAVCPSPEIEAEEGDDVFLLCHLDPPISLSVYTVDWKRVDNNKVAYSYRYGQKNHHDQMEQYKHRTSLNHEDLSRGNMTLVISSVQLSDSGRYRCFVPKLVAFCFVNLTVVPKHQRNGTKEDDFTTAKPPHEEPADPDGKTINIVLAVVFSTVVICLVGSLAWISRRKIQTCWREFRGRMKQQAAMENNPELGCPLRHGNRDLGDDQ